MTVDVSEETYFLLTGCLFAVLFNPEDGSSMFILMSVDCTAAHPRRYYSPFSPL
jgi:hypothetical protein